MYNNFTLLVSVSIQTTHRWPIILVLLMIIVAHHKYELLCYKQTLRKMECYTLGCGNKNYVSKQETLHRKVQNQIQTRFKSSWEKWRWCKISKYHTKKHFLKGTVEHLYSANVYVTLPCIGLPIDKRLICSIIEHLYNTWITYSAGQHHGPRI